MAVRTYSNTYFKRVLVMAVRASIQTFSVHIPLLIILVWILVTTTRLTTIQSGCGCEVMDVDEAEVCTDLITVF